MKTLLIAATALTMSGSALAVHAQSTSAPHTTHQAFNQQAYVDASVPLTAPAHWTAEQRTLWQQHYANMPAHWTAQQRTAYQQMLTHPPAHWTAEQRALWEEHYANLPATWTEQQRSAYRDQMAAWRTPWVTQTAQADTGMQTATSAISPRVVQPSNASPERDMRGIAVISDPAIVPDGFNGFGQTGMGGPFTDPQTGENIQMAPAGYPPCTASVTDNCIQLYERGVRQSLATWDRTTGGLAEGYETQAGMGGPLEDKDAYDPTAHHVTGDTYAGVGGPIDERTGYPPCQPGPGDDRCIQLYERGVTGAGN